MQISVRQLPSGWWHIRGVGPCNWAQPPSWPCSDEELRQSAFCQAGESFIRAAVRARDATLEEK